MNNPFPAFIELLKNPEFRTTSIIEMAEQIALAHGQLIDEAENATRQVTLLTTQNRNLQEDLNKTSEALTRQKQIADRLQVDLNNAQAKLKVASGQRDTAEGLVTSLTKQLADSRRELAAAQAREEASQRQIDLSMKTCGELRENLKNATLARELADSTVKRLDGNLHDQMLHSKRLADALKHAEAEAQKDHHQIQRLAAGLHAAENDLADLRWLTRMTRIAANLPPPGTLVGKGGEA